MVVHRYSPRRASAAPPAVRAGFRSSGAHLPPGFPDLSDTGLETAFHRPLSGRRGLPYAAVSVPHRPGLCPGWRTSPACDPGPGVSRHTGGFLDVSTGGPSPAEAGSARRRTADRDRPGGDHQRLLYSDRDLLYVFIDCCYPGLGQRRSAGESLLDCLERSPSGPSHSVSADRAVLSPSAGSRLSLDSAPHLAALPARPGDLPWGFPAGPAPLGSSK